MEATPFLKKLHHAASLTPSDIELPRLRSGDRRIGHLIPGIPPDSHSAVLIGFPGDEGVRRNGGRPGAALAPAAIRRALHRLTPPAEDSRFTKLLGHLLDAGDLEMSGDVAQDQDRLGAVVGEILREGAVAIVLGGGNEVSYGHFLGYTRAGLNVEIVNLDAHPDVRPVEDQGPHSGSSFRLALEHPSHRLQRYTVAGLLPWSAPPEHVRYIREKKGCIVWKDDLTTPELHKLYRAGQGPIMACFDMDAVDSSEAPGVSAPATGGLRSEVWLKAALEAGASPRVHSMDLTEVNPLLDADGRTARLAALTVWHFLEGMAKRK